MGRIEIKKIPEGLHPAGERILKIMYDDKEPPKEYIWGKGEDDYYRWDGKQWVPYEFELINDPCGKKNCGCIGKEEMAVKFDKFKKEVLAAVLKMNKSQDATNIADIRAQLSELKILIRKLEELEDYYTKEEINNGFYNKVEIDQKTSALNNITTVLNGSVTSLSRRISGLETNLSDMLPIIDRLNAIDHSQFITARDISDEYDWDDPSIDYLDGYATKDYVDRAMAKIVSSAPEALDTLKELSDAIGGDPNFATNITNALANKTDKSESAQLEARIESLENNPATDSGIITRIETLENKPFDQYLTNDDALVISTGLNDLNDRVAEIEKGYLTEQDEFVIASGLNDLNTRVSTLENEQIITENPD